MNEAEIKPAGGHPPKVSGIGDRPPKGETLPKIS